VEKLLGDFAFAVWDERKRQLFMARDHIGHKPLFFHRAEHFFMFASQPSALFTDPRVPRDIHDENLVLDMAMIQLERGATLYRGIERVPAGHALLVDENSTVRLRHWRPETLAELRYKRDDDYVEAFRSLLDEAVGCRLRSLHPIGSHLSSGWDSSAVTVTAASLLGNRRLTAFTAVPPAGWRADVVDRRVITDEGPISAAVARQFSHVEHVTIAGSGRLDLTALDRHAAAFEVPLKVVNNAGWLESLHGEARSRGIRVMLSGGMGNRTVSYDGFGLLPRLFRHASLPGLAREWRELHRRGHSHKELGARTFGPYLPEVVWNILRRSSGRQDPIEAMRTGLHSRALSERRVIEIGRSGRFSPATAHRMDDRTMRRFCTQTPDLSFVWGGGLAAYDVEMREPAGDRRLMAFRAAVPERQFLCNGQLKWLARRAMEGRLPDVLTGLRGRGLQAAEWFEASSQSREALRAEVECLAADPRMESLIDIPWLKKSVDEWPDRRCDAEQTFRYRRFLGVVTAARFARRFAGQTQAAGC
jgi:asparagine synthase (glutamine-hydrolysing)